MRIVFMGTPEFAIPSLRSLVENHVDVVGVVTVPDKPVGRGQQLSPSLVKQYALQHDLPVYQPEKLRDPGFIRQLSEIEPDIFVIVAFRILPPEVFKIPKYGSFNLHASLLPNYRGAAPINWAIIHGEKETGVTTFFLQETIDTGNVILQARLPIGDDETAGELHDRLAELGAETVRQTVRLIEAGTAKTVQQDNSLASPAPKIFKEHCRIDWAKSKEEVHNFVRGLSPRPCAFTFHGTNQIRVYRTRVIGQFQEAAPGEIRQADRQLVVSTGTGVVEITELQQEGKKRLAAEEFLRGYRLTVGEKFA